MGQTRENILDLEPQEAEEKEEIVKVKFLKGGCDVFFCSQYSPLSKARRRNAPEPLKSRGRGVGIAQLRDSDAGWMWDHQTQSWASQNRTGSSAAAGQRLREFSYEAKAKRGKKRRE